MSAPTTNPLTNTLTGTANTPVSIGPGALQTFLVAWTPFDQYVPLPGGPTIGGFGPIPSTDLELAFGCANTTAAPSIPGLNSLLFSADHPVLPDVIAVSATATNNGIAVVPGVNGIAAFSVSGVNIGSAATITARPVAKHGVPVALAVCETTGTVAGACLAPPSETVTTTFGVNDVRTFTVLVTGTGTSIPQDLAASRVTLQLEDAGGRVRGATNVAVQTGPAP